jgi:serine protease Do
VLETSSDRKEVVMSARTLVGSLLLVGAGVLFGLLLGVSCDLSGLGGVRATPGDDPQPAVTAEVLPSPFVAIAENVSPSVVNISARSRVEGGRDFSYEGPFEEFFREFFRYRQPPEGGSETQSRGSGFILDADGYILTNNHVIQSKEAKIDVVLSNEKRYNAEVIGLDPESDLALIKIEADEKLPVAPLGDSDELRVGDWVAAIGNPFGLDRTLTHGVVSALGREGLAFGGARGDQTRPAYQDYIQTDASINFGNSGGPLVSIRGAVVGVNSAITTPSGGNVGIGFAIPINIAKHVISDLKAHGKVIRGWLGVQISKLTPDLAEGKGIEGVEGVLVVEVIKDSPAEKAGFKRGDVVLSVNGQAVETPSELQLLIADMPVSEKVRVKVLRDKSEKNLEVTLGERPESGVVAEQERRLEWPGIDVVDAESQQARALGVQEDEGVVVVRVDQGSAADEAGIQRGDLILEVQEEAVRDESDYRRLIDRVKESGKPAVIYLRRDGNPSYVAIRPSKEGE